MIELRDIHYVRVGTRDLNGAQKFCTEIVGLQAVERTKDRLYLKSDARHHTVCYFDGDPGDHTVAFELKDWTQLGAALERLQSAGVPCGAGTTEEAADRHVEAFIWFNDPTGNRIEIVALPHDAGKRFFPSRDAGLIGFGHVGL